jgi:hypothetical protein
VSRVVPERESLKRAIRWLSDQRREAAERGEPPRPVAALVDEAARRFDLSPRDAEFLIEFERDARRAAEGK